jgi:uncharacterized membrane protein (DUF2068 family)
VAALYLAGHDAADTLARWVARLHLDPGSHWIDRPLAAALALPPRSLRAIGLGTFVYAAVFLVEGVGLLLRRHWAEYLAVIATASLLPLEAYELTQHVRATRVIIVAANLAIVLYLIARLRSEHGRHRE